MGRLVAFCLFVVLLFPIVAPRSVAPEAASIESSRSQPDRTELMKQSDHQRRVSQRRQAKADAQQMAAIGAPEVNARGYDYVVLVILIASAVVLAVVAGRRKRIRLRF